MLPLRAVVAIPVNNEEDHIIGCLTAICSQVDLSSGTYGVVLFLNNCEDNTANLVDAFAIDCPCPLRIITENYDKPTAGWARRKAMNAAMAWLDEAEASPGLGAKRVVLTTDADSVVAADWIARNLAAVDAGADAVAGRIVLDIHDAARLPLSLHLRGRAEAAYEALLTEIGARLDPAPGNPWPTHWTTSGATLAATCDAYRAVGGMPDLVNGEDRAFADRIRAHDLRLRQDPNIEVSTSGRLVGRAMGGAADTMARRCVEHDSPCDDRLEPIERALLRVFRRKNLRKRHEAGTLETDLTWATNLRLDHRAVSLCMDAYGIEKSFGGFHAALEKCSPRLLYRPLSPSRLRGQIVLARLVVTALRWHNRMRHGVGPRKDVSTHATDVRYPTSKGRLGANA